MTTTPTVRSGEFSIADARNIVRDLFQPDPRIYWIDFSLCIFTAHALFAVPALLPWWMPEPIDVRVALQVASFLICGLCFYRASLFIHELAHLPAHHFRAFRLYWNWFCGTCILMPAFLYQTHLGHHRRKMYGTSHDGEYIPFERRPRRDFWLYLAEPFLFPLLAVLRFYILTPLTWFSPLVRDFVHQRASSLVINPSHIRPAPSPDVLRSIRRQEIQCFNTCWISTAVLVMFFREYACALLLNGYLLGVFVLFLNQTRALASHRFTGDEKEMTFLEQMMDSANYPHGAIVNELWGPVGTRYHALHHLFPSMPYHHLPEAHRRLMAQLPADSPYRRTEFCSMWVVIWDIFKRSGSHFMPARVHEKTFSQRAGI